ncbi:PREDICTED: NKG2-D type II integral membrane protein-like isoform X2 [Poecilia mexicana]|uniref:NKG2-D type II integral membrane protein-like isoform X2 n=1 Tax=Poecilia mexicana TaxID=48701 RepID=UPI00072E1A8F|nr:PREDICTED: NKG2-D type II integral membrane protein-like isoform X2 [Poecilia mexicana]
MGDRVDPESYSTVTITKDKPAPQRDESRLIPIWTFIREHQSSGEEEEEKPTALTRSRLYLVGLGIFVALVAGTLIYMSVRTITVLENISDLTIKKKQLLVETEIMEGQIYALNLEINTKCGPCPDHWIHSRQKCYLFYDEPAPWKTWEQSQRFCQDRLARLVVIGDLEEQKFVSKHIKYYNSEHNGYWMGLQNVNYNWTWLDGRIDTLGFWAKDLPYTPGSKVRVLPERNPTNSWKQGMTGFLNKFICFIHEAPDPGDVEPSN